MEDADMPEKSADLPLNCNLIDYSVLHLHTEVKNDRGFSRPLSIKPDVRFDIGKREYKTFLYCSYAIDGFEFSCGIEGSFEYSEPIEGKNFVNAWWNASTMIYGIMRGVFSTTSAQAIHVAKFLPAVMMINIIKHRVEELAKQKPDDKPDQQKQIEEPAEVKGQETK